MIIGWLFGLARWWSELSVLWNWSVKLSIFVVILGGQQVILVDSCSIPFAIVVSCHSHNLAQQLTESVAWNSHLPRNQVSNNKVHVYFEVVPNEIKQFDERFLGEIRMIASFWVFVEKLDSVLFKLVVGHTKVFNLKILGQQVFIGIGVD